MTPAVQMLYNTFFVLFKENSLMALEVRSTEELVRIVVAPNKLSGDAMYGSLSVPA